MEAFPFHGTHKVLDYKMCILAHEPYFVMLETYFHKKIFFENIVQGHQSECASIISCLLEKKHYVDY
jgi:hypothetical protein